jgi:hypothetical protein
LLNFLDQYLRTSVEQQQQDSCKLGLLIFSALETFLYIDIVAGSLRDHREVAALQATTLPVPLEKSEHGSYREVAQPHKHAGCYKPILDSSPMRPRSAAKWSFRTHPVMQIGFH